MEIEQALQLASNLLVQADLRPLTDVDTLILRGAWEQKTYEQIAQETGYSSNYLRKDVGPKLWRDLSVALGEPVSKTNFKFALDRQLLPRLPFSIQEPSTQKPSTQEPSTQKPACQSNDFRPRCDWGEAIDVSTFLGRVQEQEILSQWLVSDRCRFIWLLGMGGIGKTALSIKVGQMVQSDFEFVIWRSLRNAPPLVDLLADLIKFLTEQQDIELPPTSDARISQLLQSLRKQRCLLILDNAEAILQAGDRYGYYQPGYEDYGQLCQQIGETAHLSCLMVTSRERPRDLVPQVGMSLPVRSLTIKGLSYIEGRDLISSTGQFTGDLVSWQLINERYAGNPLALKIAASFIRAICNGDLYEFLAILGRSSFIFDDIRDLLDQQFQRLSTQEREVMMWLAIRREPVSLLELLEDFVQPVPPHQLLQVLASLQGRSLIEKVENNFTQQPVVMEYITQCLIERVSEQFCRWQVEDVIDNSSLLQQYALIQVQAKDYVREAQIRLILQPILNCIMTRFGNIAAVELYVQQILEAMRTDPAHTEGYATGNIINLLRQLGVDLSGYDFSQLTVWQADLQGITLYDVDFSGADLSKSRFSQTFGWITTIAFSPDGNYWAAGDTAGSIHLWSCDAEQHQITLKAHQSFTFTIAISPDSQRLVSGSLDGTIKFWELRTGQCLYSLNAHKKIVWSVAFSKDGNWFASGCEDGSIKVWDCKTGQCLQTLSANQSSIRSVVFTADSHHVLSAGEDRQVRLWDLTQGRCIKIFEGHSQTVWAVDVSPDDRYVVSGGNDTLVKLWDIQTGRCLQNFEGHTLQIWSVAFSPDGQAIASGSMDQTARLWNLRDRQCTACFRGHSSMVMSVAFSADSKTLASGGMDRLIKHWDLESKACARTWSGYKNIIWSVAFSPDGQTVTSSSLDGIIRIWQVADHQCIQTLKHPAEVHAIAFSPNGQQLVSGNMHSRSTLKVWDVQQGTCLTTIPAHIGKVNSVCFHPSGSLIASGGDDKAVQIFNLNHQQVEKILQGHQAVIWCVAFSTDGQLLASGSFDETVHLWDVESGRCLHVLSGHTNALTTIVFHPLLPFIATASSDATVKVWSLETGHCDRTLSDHQNIVMGIAFSPDGQTFASGSYDTTIRIWDVASWQCQAVLQANSIVHSVAFSPDGQTLVSGGDNGTLQLWDVATEQCIKVLKLPELYAGMKIHGIKGLTDAQQAMLIGLGATTSKGRY
ncbi:pentapeptide repeat-containing protein [Phormidium tenue FACHB-886]|nr:pentapeptide repeat-containing protein [Phormidium tenue FACHB-886]